MHSTLRMALAVVLLPLAACRADTQPEPDTVIDDTPTSAVIDDAEIIPEAAEAELANRLSDYWNAERTAIIVNTITDLGGQPIEDYAFATFNRWGIGDAETDRGVLLVIARDDRQLRIAVGCGLETVLTDAVAGDIIEQDIVPEFEKGAFAEGIEAGVDSIMATLAASEVEPGPVSPACLEAAS